MKAAIYCRVSTDGQEREGTSLDSQREACLTKARELGYEVSPDNIFAESWPGPDMDRPGLDAIRDLVRHQLVNCLVCFSTDRLARNPIHIAIVAEECEKRGIDLVFVTEPLDNSPEGQLIRYVKGYAAQIEHEKIRERTMRGKRTKARQGKLSTGGARLFGYDYVDGRRVINDSEARLVTQVFDWFAFEGYTLYRAAAELNRAGISAPRGGKWTENTIHRLLNNPAYMGETYVFRYKVVEPVRPKVEKRRYPKTTHKFRDRAEWIEVPNATPAIVSKDVYQASQGQLEANRLQSPPRNRKHQHLFTNGRLRCGVCGRSMVGAAKKKPNGDWLFYRCICNVKSSFYERCHQPGIAASRIESLVWVEIAKVLKDPTLVMNELSKLRNENVVTALDADQYVVQNELQKVRQEQQRYLRQYGQGNIDETMFLQENARSQKRQEELEAKLKKLQDEREAIEHTGIQVEKALETVAVIADRIDTADYETKQLALDALDIHVTPGSEGIIHITGAIPTEVQPYHVKSLPSTMALPGMILPCLKR